MIPDPRNPDYITHTQLGLLRQSAYGLSLGYEDLNDHKTMRNDPALQTAVDLIIQALEILRTYYRVQPSVVIAGDADR